MPKMVIFMLPVFYIILKNKRPITESRVRCQERIYQELELKISCQFRKHCTVKLDPGSMQKEVVLLRVVSTLRCSECPCLLWGCCPPGSLDLWWGCETSKLPSLSLVKQRGFVCV